MRPAACIAASGSAGNSAINGSPSRRRKQKRDGLWAVPLVGMTGFEPATTRPPDVYSTGLSYIPLIFYCDLERYIPSSILDICS